jgi:hypothetical protein
MQNRLIILLIGIAFVGCSNDKLVEDIAFEFRWNHPQSIRISEEEISSKVIQKCIDDAEISHPIEFEGAHSFKYNKSNYYVITFGGGGQVRDFGMLYILDSNKDILGYHIKTLV